VFKGDLMIEAVIFDRDGVLAFFDDPAISGFFTRLLPIGMRELRIHWNAHGAQQGWPRTVAEEKQFFASFWRRLSDAYDLPPAALHALEGWDYRTVMRPFEDARPIMAWLRRQGIKVGVLSNFSLASLEPSLEALELSEYVDIACSAPVIGVSKPAPAAFQITADRLGVAPERCLVLDDKIEHVDGARAAGMQAFLLDRSGAAPAPDAQTIRSLAELQAIILSQPDFNLAD
jgi:putative hydrolase of the HAD superfamily